MWDSYIQVLHSTAACQCKQPRKPKGYSLCCPKHVHETCSDAVVHFSQQFHMFCTSLSIDQPYVFFHLHLSYLNKILTFYCFAFFFKAICFLEVCIHAISSVNCYQHFPTCKHEQKKNVTILLQKASCILYKIHL